MRASRYIAAAGILLVLAGCHRSGSFSDSSFSDSDSSLSGSSSRGASTNTSTAIVDIKAPQNVCWSGRIGRAERSGCGNATVHVEASDGAYTVNLQKTKGDGGVAVNVIVHGRTVESTVITQSSTVTVNSGG